MAGLLLVYDLLQKISRLKKLYDIVFREPAQVTSLIFWYFRS